MGRDARVTEANGYRFFAGRSDPFFDTQGYGLALSAEAAHQSGFSRLMGNSKPAIWESGGLAHHRLARQLPYFMGIRSIRDSRLPRKLPGNIATGP